MQPRSASLTSLITLSLSRLRQSLTFVATIPISSPSTTTQSSREIYIGINRSRQVFFSTPTIAETEQLAGIATMEPISKKRRLAPKQPEQVSGRVPTNSMRAPKLIGNTAAGPETIRVSLSAKYARRAWSGSAFRTV